MDRWVGKTAVVTGASAGIGADIALSLANAGMIVVATARRYNKIEELVSKVTGSGKILPFQCDVGKEEDIKALFEYTKKHANGVDVLVNNAALLPVGTITDCRDSKAVYVTDNEVEQCIMVNVVGVTLATRLAVEDMKARKVKGYIIIINSIAGHRFSSMGFLPNVSVYPVSKAAITQLTQILRLEFSFTGTPIRITSLSPGAVDTAMFSSINTPENPLPPMPMLKSSDISDTVIYLLSTPDNVNISELTIEPLGELV